MALSNVDNKADLNWLQNTQHQCWYTFGDIIRSEKILTLLTLAGPNNKATAVENICP